MSQLDLFGATSGCQQVIYKERDNEKEKSPHTPLKGKETEKETSAIIISCLPSEATPSGARACVREGGQGMMMTDCVSQNPAVLSSVESPPTPPARDQEMMKVAYSMQRTCKGLIVSADTANAAHRYIKKMLVFFRVPPPVVHLDLGDVRYIDEASYPSEWDRLMSGHVYLRALGAEFVPGHFNAEGVKIAAFLRQYLRPGRNAAQHRLLISTRLSAARFSKRYSNDVLQLVLANCLPVKLRTIKEEWL